MNWHNARQRSGSWRYGRTLRFMHDFIPFSSTVILFILILSGILLPILPEKCTSTTTAELFDFSNRYKTSYIAAYGSFKCDVPASEWIDEDYEMRYLSLLRIDILSEYGIHKLSVLNRTGLSANDLKLFYIQNKTELLDAINISISILLNDTLNSVLSGLSWKITQKDITINESSMQIISGKDMFNPPVVVNCYIRLEISADSFGLPEFSTYTPDDILAGILGMGAEIRIPVGLYCLSGHNETIRNYPPAGLIFGDGKRYYAGNPVVWELSNYNGTNSVAEKKTLSIISEDRASYTSAKVSTDVIIRFTNVTFLNTGETELVVNFSAIAGIFRIVVNRTVQAWFSQYFSIKYINSDFIRLLLNSGIISYADLNSVINFVSNTLQAGIKSAFPDITDLKYRLNISHLNDTINVKHLTDQYPISISIEAAFKYLYKPTKSLDHSSWAVRLLQIRRTYVSTIPGPKAMGVEFMGDGIMNYTFTLPPDVIIYNVTANGKRVDTIKRDGSYSFIITFAPKDENKTMMLVFGADIDYPIDPLVPYLLLIMALIVVWIVLYIVARRKIRIDNEEKIILSERGELLEEDED